MWIFTETSQLQHDKQKLWNMLNTLEVYIWFEHHLFSTDSTLKASILQNPFSGFPKAISEPLFWGLLHFVAFPDGMKQSNFSTRVLSRKPVCGLLNPTVPGWTWDNFFTSSVLHVYVIVVEWGQKLLQHKRSCTPADCSTITPPVLQRPGQRWSLND